jgi:RNA polymerase sigma-70 factor, ECF subfamily
MPQKPKADNNQKREHLERLYGSHADEIFRFALYKLSDREKAKDVVQDTFVKVWGHISSEAEVLENPRAFIFKIAKNLVIDSYRKVKPMSIDALEEILHFDISDNHQAREEMHDAVDMSIVLDALNVLDVEDRDIIIMRYMDGLSVKEIADITGQRENTVSVKIHRALKDMQDHFGIDTVQALPQSNTI